MPWVSAVALIDRGTWIEVANWPNAGTGQKDAITKPVA